MRKGREAGEGRESVYITSILLAVIIVSTYTMKDLVNWGAVVFCTGIIIVTTAILSLVFVPKVAV